MKQPLEAQRSAPRANAEDPANFKTEPGEINAADAITEWSDLGALRDAALGLAQPLPGRREALSHHDARPRLKIDNGHPERTVANLRDILARSGRCMIAGRRSGSSMIRRWAASLRTS